MKRIAGYILYSFICIAVISTAVIAGINGHQCRECAIAFGEKKRIDNRLAEIRRYTLPLDDQTIQRLK